MNNVLLNDDNDEDTVLEKVNEYVASDRLSVMCQCGYINEQDGRTFS